MDDINVQESIPVDFNLSLSLTGKEFSKIAEAKPQEKQEDVLVETFGKAAPQRMTANPSTPTATAFTTFAT